MQPDRWRGGGAVRLVRAAVRVAAYLRGDDATDLDGQAAAIRAWARVRRHRVVLWEREAEGGGDALDGASMATVLGSLRSGDATGLVVADLERVAADLAGQEVIRAEALRLRASLHSALPTDAGALEDPPTGNGAARRFIIRQALRREATYRTRTQSRRLLASRLEKAAKGGPASGPARYGWRIVEGSRVPVEAEQAVIARAIELRADGRSFDRVAAALTDEGRPAPRSHRWSGVMVRRMIDRADVTTDGAPMHGTTPGGRSAAQGRPEAGR